MPRQLKEYNLGHDGTLTQISEVLAANTDLYSHIEVKCAAAFLNGKWQNALCIIRGIPKRADNPAPSPLPQYPLLRFYEKRIAADELSAFLQPIRTNQFEIQGQPIDVGQNCSLNSFEFMPAENDYSANPGHFYDMGRQSVHLPQQPLIDYNAPVFTSPYHAIAEWINIRNFSRDQDSRVGCVFRTKPRAISEQAEGDLGASRGASRSKPRG